MYKYELSLWKHYRAEEHYVEELVHIIAGNNFTHPCSAYNLVFKTKNDGDYELNFEISETYIDIKEVKQVYNFLCEYIKTGAKLKLKLEIEDKIKWYDFEIVKVDKNKVTKTLSCQAKSAATLELNRKGGNLILDTQLENNYGTVIELGEKILEGTNWKIDKNSYSPTEGLEEFIYEYRYGGLQTSGDDLAIEVTNVMTNETKTIVRGQPLYFFYSQLQVEEKNDTKIVKLPTNPEAEIQFLIPPENGFIIKDGKLQNNEQYQYNTYVGNFNGEINRLFIDSQFLLSRTEVPFTEFTLQSWTAKKVVKMPASFLETVENKWVNTYKQINRETQDYPFTPFIPLGSFTSMLNYNATEGSVYNTALTTEMSLISNDINEQLYFIPKTLENRELQLINEQVELCNYLKITTNSSFPFKITNFEGHELEILSSTECYLGLIEGINNLKLNFLFPTIDEISTLEDYLDYFKKYPEGFFSFGLIKDMDENYIPVRCYFNEERLSSILFNFEKIINSDFLNFTISSFSTEDLSFEGILKGSKIEKEINLKEFLTEDNNNIEFSQLPIYINEAYYPNNNTAFSFNQDFISDKLFSYSETRYITSSSVVNYIENPQREMSTLSWGVEPVIDVIDGDKTRRTEVRNRLFPSADTIIDYYNDPANFENENVSIGTPYLELKPINKWKGNEAPAYSYYYSTSPRITKLSLIKDKYYVLRYKMKWMQSEKNLNNDNVDLSSNENYINITDNGIIGRVLGAPSKDYNLVYNGSISSGLNSPFGCSLKLCETGKEKPVFDENNLPINELIECKVFSDYDLVNISDYINSTGKFYNRIGSAKDSSDTVRTTVSEVSEEEWKTEFYTSPFLDKDGYVYHYCKAKDSFTFSFEDKTLMLVIGLPNQTEYVQKDGEGKIIVPSVFPCIEDLQFFEYVENESGQPVFFGDNIASFVKTEKKYYKIAQNQKGEKYAKYIKPNLDNYSLVYKDKYQSVRNLSLQNSNYYNALQELIKLFDVRMKISYEHEPNGQLKLDQYNYPIKKIKFLKKQNIEDYYNSGFRLDTNISGITETIDGNNITTCLLVKNNLQEFAPNGICSISDSSSNPTGETDIINFDYYIQSGLFESNNLVELYRELKRLNKNYNYQQNIYLSNLKTFKEAYELSEMYSALISKTNQSIEDLEYQIDVLEADENTDLSDLKTSLAFLYSQRAIAQKEFDKNQVIVNGYDTEVEFRKNYADALFREKKALKDTFLRRHDFIIKESTYSDSNIIDPELYYLKAKKESQLKAFPKVTYNISAIALPEYEIDAGDMAYVYIKDPTTSNLVKIEVVVTEKTIGLDNPSKNAYVLTNQIEDSLSFFQQLQQTSNLSGLQKDKINTINNETFFSKNLNNYNQKNFHYKLNEYGSPKKVF